jgi:HlyD family secretion protein
MKSKFKNFWSYLWSHKWLLALILVVVIGAVWYAAASSKKTVYQFVTVERGTITETVSVTGNTTSTHSVSLAFQNGGTIVSVAANLGDRVSAGETIASVDTSDLRAQLQQAQANVDAQNAQLQKLAAGATPQTVAISQTALATVNQNLASTYQSVANTLTDADAKSVDAVVNQLAPFFSNPQSQNPQLTFFVSDSQLLNDIQMNRGRAGTELSTWDKEVAGISAASPGPLLDAALQNAQKHLIVMQTLMEDATEVLTDAAGLPPTTAAVYKAAVTTGFNEVNAALTEVNAAAQTIAAQKAASAQAQAQLNLTLASSTSEDVAVQQAQVEQAEASAQSIKVKIQEASIVSPIGGTVALQNAKVGQIASPGMPLVSIVGAGGFEVNADIPEVDIGKINLNDPVSMTLDAFQGETFYGKVYYINPAETISQGVVDYQVKIAFSKADPRIKSGLTVNCDITTQTKTNALILPQYAVLQNDQGTFVKTESGTIVTQVPVTLGIQDASGSVEIVSGTTEGEQVINIGLK